MYNPNFKGDVCSHRHALVLDNILRRLFQNPRKIIGPYIASGAVAVDIGCGPGFFTLEMAGMVGDDGQVLAVDLQEEMLSKVAAKAASKQMGHIIRPVLSTQDDLNLPPGLGADFILAYYMVHETLDPGVFFRQLKTALNPGGQILVVEPPFHVSAKEFCAMEKTAVAEGLIIADRPKGKGGKSLLLAL